MRSSNDQPTSNALATLSSAPEYFTAVGRTVERVAESTDRSELVQLLQEAALRLGADKAYFASFVREDTTLESYRFLLACDPLWGLEYEQTSSHAHDPWLAYARLASRG